MRLAIFLASLSVLGFVPLLYGNEVNNPSMEGNFIYQDPLGDVAEYWTGWTSGYLEGDFSEGTYAHEGIKSQEIRWSGLGYGQYHDGMYQQIDSLEGGQPYRASLWFKHRFESPAMQALGSIACGIGADPNGGTDPAGVTNWSSLEDGGYIGYDGPWLNVATFFSANSTTATIFIKVSGFGDAWEQDWEGEWDAYCYIDDVVVRLIEISQASAVTATTPVPANGTSFSEVTITVLEANDNPIEGIPASEIVVNCTGYGNTIIGPEQPTDVNGQTTALISSTIPESKIIKTTVFATVLSDTATVEFTDAGPVNIHCNLTKLLPSDGTGGHYFGASVAIEGSTAVIGAMGDRHAGGNSGAAHIFHYDGLNWLQDTKLVASDASGGDSFGCCVAISGDTVVSGARWDDDNGSDSGSAYVFWFDGTNWLQQAKLLASDGAAYDFFANSISISGDYAIVGAPYDDDNANGSGSAYIFTPNSIDPNNWDQQAKLTASDAAYGDCFGYSVSISGDYAIIGAPRDNDNGSDSGSAYIFRYDGSTWVEEAKLLASHGAEKDCFGSSVAISGGAAIVSSGDDDNGSNCGSAYIFRFDGSNWIQEAKLLASDGAAYDYFGVSVAIDGNTALIGAFMDDDNGGNSGSAYIFCYNGSEWIQDPKLLASDCSGGEHFGSSVAIEGDTALIGAYYDDDNGEKSGSLYIFTGQPIGDIDDDCDVDLIDFSILGNQWEQAPSIPSADIAPYGGDGVVDFMDLDGLCEHWLE